MEKRGAIPTSLVPIVINIFQNVIIGDIERAVQDSESLIKNVLPMIIEDGKVNIQPIQKFSNSLEFNESLASHVIGMTMILLQMSKNNKLPKKDLIEIGIGGILHDIGKYYIDPEILTKPGKLSKIERTIVQQHCELGFKVLKDYISKNSSDIILYHHEHADGNGYPHNLDFNHTPYYAKMASVADVYEALTAKRIYKEGNTPQEAIDFINRGLGTQFDPYAVKLFLSSIIVYPNNYNVYLSDGREAKILSQNENPLKPTVSVLTHRNDNSFDYEIINLNKSMLKMDTKRQ